MKAGVGWLVCDSWTVPFEGQGPLEPEKTKSQPISESLERGEKRLLTAALLIDLCIEPFVTYYKSLQTASELVRRHASLAESPLVLVAARARENISAGASGLTG